jgi:hypothetical protein
VGSTLWVVLSLDIQVTVVSLPMFALTARISNVHEAGYCENCPSQILLQIALYSNFRIFYVQYLQVTLFILE